MPKIPDAVLCNLRCARCKNWISCGPTRLLSSGRTLCGRCQTHKDGPKGEYRHYAFEALACYFKFPCKNFSNNCPELQLSFKRTLEHERKCSYDSACGMFFMHPIASCMPKKYLDRKTEIPFLTIPDEVLQYLRCGSCAGYLSSSPVHVCRDGTSICHRCSQQVYPNDEFIKDEDFEKLVFFMIFPCIFRFRGCTQYYKFGELSEEHESECSYGKPVPATNWTAKLQPENVRFKKPEPIINRQESILKRHESELRRQESLLKSGQKERGVIKTTSGHIYATITPNAPLFMPQAVSSKRYENNDDIFNQYREQLANKWGRGYQGPTVTTKNFEEVRNSVDGEPSNNNQYPERNGVSGDDSPPVSISDKIDNMFANIEEDRYPDVITELKIMQQQNKVVRINSPRLTDSGRRNYHQQY